MENDGLIPLHETNNPQGLGIHMVPGLGNQHSWAGWNRSKITKNTSRSQAKGQVSNPSTLALVAVLFTVTD